MRLDLKVINNELARLGHTARLQKGQGHFYFHLGEAAGWLDPGVGVRTINSLTLKQWIEEFRRVKELNERLMQTLRPTHAKGAAAEIPPGKKR